MKKPNSMRHLDDAIRRLGGNTPQEFVRVRTVMANAIVASMLPDGVVKREGWDEMYAGLAKGLPVLQNIDDAVRWVNETIVTIDNAR